MTGDGRSGAIDLDNHAVEAGINSVKHGTASLRSKEYNANNNDRGREHDALNDVLPLTISHTVNIPYFRLFVILRYLAAI
jgi:hypothetical protein